MEALQILKFSIRKGYNRPLKFTEGMSWEEENKEFEIKALTAPLGDAEAYGRSLEEPDVDLDDLMSVVDKIDFETLEQELINELEGSESEEDEDDIYAS